MVDPAPDSIARLCSFRRLAVATTIAVFITVAAGSFVRAAGAGLGCHSWPKCFEWSWFPPTSIEQVPEAERATISIAKAWIEYVNRLVGAVLGLMIVVLWFQARKSFRHRSDVFKPVCWSLVLVLFEGALGGIVVRQKLDPRLVSVHLLGGLVLALLAVYVTMNASLAKPYVHKPETWSRERKKYHAFVVTLLTIVLANEIVGALVRGTIEKVAQPRADLARGDWLEQVGWLDWTHRKLALVTLVLVIAGVWLARRLGDPNANRVVSAATVCGLLALGQILAGMVLAYFALPPAAQVIHVTLGVLLVGGLFRQILVVRRL